MIYGVRNNKGVTLRGLYKLESAIMIAKDKSLKEKDVVWIVQTSCGVVHSFLNGVEVAS